MQHPFDYLELSTGTLLFTPCPGTKGVSLSDSLGQLKAAGAAAVITLMPTHELEQNDAEHIGVICEELGLELNAKRVMPLLISEMEAFIAERPTYTILSTMKLSGVIQDGVRSWQAAVGDYLATFYAKS